MTIIHSSELGWTAGQDITDEFAALAQTFKSGDTFVFDHMYDISGSRIQLPDNFTLAGGAPGAGIDVIDSPSNTAPLLFFGNGNTIVDLTVKHSNSPNSGTDSLNPQKGSDWDGKYGFSSRGKDDISILNSSFEGNIAVLLDIHGGKNLLVENTEFNGGNAQLRLLGDVDSPTIHQSLFQNALSDGIKTLKGENAAHTKDAVVSESVFLNNNRDGIDTTGGFRDSIVTDSYFVGNWAGLDIKDIYDSDDDFALGGPVNKNILITNTEFINHPNAIVVTTLDRTGDGVLHNNDPSKWVAQDIHLEDSIVENTSDNPGFARMFFVKSSDDISWDGVQALGDVTVPPRLQDMGFHVPGGIGGSQVETGDPRATNGDGYYEGLAGPDWSAISYPADGTYTPRDLLDEPDPSSTPPVEEKPVVETPEGTDHIPYTPPGDENPVVEWAADPVAEAPAYREPAATPPLHDVDTAAGEIVYRWNAGKSDVVSIDGGPNWTADDSILVGGPTNISTGNIFALDATAQKFNIPAGVLAQERWDPDSGLEMSLEFGKGALEAGEYAVRLIMGNAFGGTSSVGTRQFDVMVEDKLFLDNTDLIHSFGHQVGGVYEWVGEVTDGTVDIDFVRAVQNPLINGVEVVQLSTTSVDHNDDSETTPSPPPEDGPVEQAPPDPDPISYTAPVEKRDTVFEEEQITEAPESGNPLSGMLRAEEEPVAETPVDPVSDPPTTIVELDPVNGEILYRWNAGRSDVAAIDDGPDWVADTSFLVGGQTNVSNGDISDLDATAEEFNVPLAIFEQERWDPSSGSEMSLEFGDGSLAAGEYAVRLLMGNAFGGTSTVGQRQFNVMVEDESFLDYADLVESFGHQTGGAFEWVGEVTDGTIDIDFERAVQNPLINGVEIVQLSIPPIETFTETYEDDDYLDTTNAFNTLGFDVF